MKLNEPLSHAKTLIAVLSLILLSILLYKIWDSDLVYGYRKYFSSDDVIQLNFNELHSISPKETRAKFNINWWCGFDKNEFGDYFCADELKGWNKSPAMLVVFWYKNNKLNNAKIDAPYWHHSKFIRQIKAEYGEPIRKSQRLDYLKITEKLALLLLSNGKYSGGSGEIKTEDLAIWQLKSGGLLITELKPGSNPFTWNSVLWVSPEQAKSATYYH
ncbi:MAG: hypothetical protein WBL28_06555 [Methylotenera sp.]